jgi:hypothetical protein
MTRSRGQGYRANEREEERLVTSLAEQMRRGASSQASESSQASGDPQRGEASRVIVLPGVSRPATLAEEFADHLPLDVIERAVAAARHALERAHRPATADAVDQLAREHLRARVAAFVSRRRG